MIFFRGSQSFLIPHEMEKHVEIQQLYPPFSADYAWLWPLPNVRLITYKSALYLHMIYHLGLGTWLMEDQHASLVYNLDIITTWGMFHSSVV